LKNMYPNQYPGMNPDNRQMYPGSTEFYPDMDQNDMTPMNPYEMNGMNAGETTGNMQGYPSQLTPLQMSGIDEEYLTPMDQYEMDGMQQGMSPMQMSDMPSMNPYPMSEDMMGMGQNQMGNEYTYTPATPYGPQYGYTPPQGFKPQFMQGTGHSGYGAGLPYGPYQVGPTEGYFAPGAPYVGGSPAPGYGMPGQYGQYGMYPGTPSPRRRLFW
jgi:hypothetical protein